MRWTAALFGPSPAALSPPNPASSAHTILSLVGRSAGRCRAQGGRNMQACAAISAASGGWVGGCACTVCDWAGCGVAPQLAMHVYTAFVPLPCCRPALRRHAGVRTLLRQDAAFLTGTLRRGGAAARTLPPAAATRPQPALQTACGTATAAAVSNLHTCRPPAHRGRPAAGTCGTWTRGASSRADALGAYRGGGWRSVLSAALQAFSGQRLMAWTTPVACQPC